MALNIEVGSEYKITSDSMNLILNRKHIVDPTKAVGWKPGGETRKREEWREYKYFGTIDKALEFIVEQGVRESDATTIGELLAEIQAIRREISAVLGR